ncbi:antirepressor AbbA [Bacillus sp. FJAT-47783]|uniref:antirepressor AbbA n=1 Tax=Bacillus sp. FJAT-47783 TaxID=2922712 RepID=UPI001FADDDA0|nr:antirepressor AbbA [Bacillus sp. FJAT-47783]
MRIAVRQFSKEDQQLLVDVLFSQEYAIELLESELHDIENGHKKVDFQTYKKLIDLYDKIRLEFYLT